MWNFFTQIQILLQFNGKSKFKFWKFIQNTNFTLKREKLQKASRYSIIFNKLDMENTQITLFWTTL